VALSPCRTGRDNLHSTKCFGWRQAYWTHFILPSHSHL
jgi:hypothetical protein